MRISTPGQQYDIVIIGGGMVGASFALSLTRSDSLQAMRVLVVESVSQSGEDVPAAGLDVRTTALSFGSRCIYESLGIWKDIANCSEAIRHIHVSDRGHFGATRIDAQSLDVEALGYVAENRHLGRVLQQALDQSSALDFLCPAVIKSLQPVAEGMRLQLSMPGQEAQLEISARLVVLADGGKSGLPEQLGIERIVTRYEQKALISNIAFTRPHRNVAYERFTDTGPIAVLPLPDENQEHRGSLIWTLPQTQADYALGLDEEAFLELLQERFGRRLGRFSRAGTRAVFPLSLSVAREQLRPGLVLLGNVAHTLHPVAGQGLNLALRDAQVLSETLQEAAAKGKSPGAMDVLLDYFERQKRDQATTISFSHYVTQLFSSTHSALVWGRKFGLVSIDLLPAVKSVFTRQAMGMADRSRTP